MTGPLAERKKLYRLISGFFIKYIIFPNLNGGPSENGLELYPFSDGLLSYFLFIGV